MFDAFDPAKYAVSATSTEALGVKKHLNRLQVRKPNRQDFVRSHPEMRTTVAIVEIKEDREVFLVDPEIMPMLAGDVAVKTLVLAVTRQGNPFVWPLTPHSPEARPSAWNESALAAEKIAQKSWVRMASNMGAGEYDVFESSLSLEPRWPDIDLRQMLELAFRGHLIDREDHPIVLRLTGQE